MLKLYLKQLEKLDLSKTVEGDHVGFSTQGRKFWSFSLEAPEGQLLLWIYKNRYWEILICVAVIGVW